MIKIKNLSFKFDKVEIFKDFNLNIFEGESCVITGINGVGKSTLLRLMAGVMLPDSGVVEYSEKLGDRPKQKIGFISDKISMYESLSVKETIRLHKSIYKIEDFDYKLLKHTKINYTQKVKELSIGQKTILFLSMVLSAEPDILLIDEVIHSLDAYLRKLFLDQIIELLAERKVTLVMVNVNFHDIENIVDRIILLKNGTIIVDEDIDSLKSKVKRINGDNLNTGLPVISKMGNFDYPDIYIYPYQEEFKGKIAGDIEDLNLTEIVTAFIGGEYDI